MNRYVVYGAGAIGGTVGAALFEAGFEVVLIARGPHFEVLQKSGLTFETPSGSRSLPIAVVDHPDRMSFRDDDVVLMTVKSQDTNDCLNALAHVATRAQRIVCLQNGVTNELSALRFFSHVFGGFVYCPALHLTPGVVRAYGANTIGLFDVGRFPDQRDGDAERICADFAQAGLSSVARDDISRWKYRKLLNNLNNVLNVVFTTRNDDSPVATGIQSEGRATLEQAGISWAALSELGDRSLPGSSAAMIATQSYANSSWQSVTRHAGSVETDYLNGEIVRLGRLHAYPTPLNALCQRLSREVVEGKRTPAIMTETEFFDLLDD